LSFVDDVQGDQGDNPGTEPMINSAMEGALSPRHLSRVELYDLTPRPSPLVIGLLPLSNATTLGGMKTVAGHRIWEEAS
jgi:hypothetical protein